MKKIKFAIAGPGGVARLHAKAIAEIEDAELSLVYSHREESAKKFGKEFGIKYTTDYKSVLESDVDVIDICTPHNIRLSLIVPAVEYKKHILCEKPLSISEEEGKKIINLVKASGIKFSVIFQSRFLPSIIQVKEFIEKGGLGKLFLITSYVKWYRPSQYYTRWHGRWETEGGGVLINQAIHDLDLMLFLGGDVKEVASFVDHLYHDIEVEDTAVGILRYKNGHLGNIIATTSIYPGYPKSLEIHGENGSIFLKEGKLSRIDLKKDIPFAPSPIKEDAKSGAANPLDIDISGHKSAISDIINAIRENREPKVPPSEAIRSVILVNALYKANREKKIIKLGEA